MVQAGPVTPEASKQPSVQFWDTPCRKDIDLLEQPHRKARKDLEPRSDESSSGGSGGSARGKGDSGRTSSSPHPLKGV